MKNKALRGEVWFINLNPSIGHEQAGIRPALVISDDLLNQSLAEMVIVIPITSKNKNIPTHIEINYDFLEMKSYIKTEDIRAISVNRLIERLGMVDSQILDQVSECLKMLLGFS
jgi:mRNA interferase MazF